MGKFLDALLMRPVTPSGFSETTMATSAQPVPVAFIRTPPGELTSDAALNQAAVGAWPTLIDAGAKLWTIGGWRKSKLREVANRNEVGNYGAVTSKAHYGFLYRAFQGVGNYANEGFGNPHVPEWNELTPIQWGLRVPNPNTPTNTTQQKGSISIQTTPSTWEGSNTASLKNTGEVLL